MSETIKNQLDGGGSITIAPCCSSYEYEATDGWDES